MAEAIIDVLNQKIMRLCEKIITHGLPIFDFTVSIAFYLRTYDSAQIKITLMQIGGAILVGAWLVKLLEEESVEYFKKNMVLVLPLIAFLASGIYSWSHSPFFYASANELVRRVVYISLALISMKEVNSDQKFRRLFGWLFWACFVAVFYGVIQHLDYLYFPPPPEQGLDPFIWRQAFSARVFSTFGNPNFFGDFLVVLNPLLLAMYLHKRKKWIIILWLMVSANVIWTASKGAWLGYAVGILAFVFFAVAFFVHANKVKVRKILWVLALGTVIVVSVGMYKNIAGRTDSASFRIFTWLSTWEMINTHPWIGTGIGTYYVTYPAWRRPQIFFIEGRHNTETDHPEDEYLEVWYDEGFIGMGIFLWLIGVYLTMGIRNMRVFSENYIEKNKVDQRAYYQLGILSALIAQLAHNFVCVSLRFVSAGIFLWLMIGLAGALAANSPLPKDTLEPPAPPNKLPKLLKRSLQAGVVLAALYFIKIFYGYFDADVNHNLAIFFSKQGQWVEALNHYDTVAGENPSFIMAHYFMGNVYNDRWQPGDAALSIKKYEDVWRLAPNYVQSHHQAGLIYMKWAEDEKRQIGECHAKGDKAGEMAHTATLNGLWGKALAEFELYREVDPIFPVNYYRIAMVYMEMGDYNRAEATYLAHINYPENLKKAPHNAWVEDWAVRRKGEYSDTYGYLGYLAASRNDTQKAEGYYLKSVELNPENVNVLKNLAVLYGRTGRMDKSIPVWQKLYAIAPHDPDVQRVFQQKK